MNHTVRFLFWLYARLLRLYPRAYRNEFGAEMEADFLDMLHAQQPRGALSLLVTFGRELRDLVSAALQERWKETRIMTISPRPISFFGIGLAMLPFVALALITAPNLIHLPQWAVVSLFAIYLLGFVIGIARGLPEWSLPYAGLLLMIVNLALLSIWIVIFQLVFSEQAVAWARGLTSLGLWWWNLMLITPLFLLLTALAKPWRSFFERVCADWTALAFLLYSVTPIVLLITFDEYRGEEFFKLGGLAALMIAAAVYLSQRNHRIRVFALASGIIVGMALVGLGKYQIIPQQTWVESVAETYRGELTDVFITWVWLMLTILAMPALLAKFIHRFSLGTPKLA